jgi:hypothetical protein
VKYTLVFYRGSDKIKLMTQADFEKIKERIFAGMNVDGDILGALAYIEAANDQEAKLRLYESVQEIFGIKRANEMIAGGKL